MKTVTLSTLRIIYFLAIMAASQASVAQPEPGPHLNIIFQDGTYSFTEEEKSLVTEVIKTSENNVRRLLPDLPATIDFTLEIIDRDIDIVSGASGWSQAHSPARRFRRAGPARRCAPLIGKHHRARSSHP